jgi:hypothetical protein
MSARRGTFESLVSAADAGEAVKIAAEALPKGAEMTFSDAADVSSDHGPDSWFVTIKFKRAAPEGEY